MSQAFMHEQHGFFYVGMTIGLYTYTLLITADQAAAQSYCTIVDSILGKE